MSTTEPFLESFNFISKFLRIFGLNNFPFPTTRIQCTKLKIRLRNKMFTASQMCLFILILVISNIIPERSLTLSSASTDYVVVFLSLVGVSVLFINLYIEMQYRQRIWAIISGISYVDCVVCVNFNDRIDFISPRLCVFIKINVLFVRFGII